MRMELGLESGYGLKSGSFSQTPWLRFLLFGEFAAGTSRGVPITPGLPLIGRCPSPRQQRVTVTQCTPATLRGLCPAPLGPWNTLVFHRPPLSKPSDSGHHRFTCLIPRESLGLQENLNGRWAGPVLEPSPCSERVRALVTSPIWPSVCPSDSAAHRHEAGQGVGPGREPRLCDSDEAFSHGEPWFSSFVRIKLIGMSHLRHAVRPDGTITRVRALQARGCWTSVFLGVCPCAWA